MTDARIATEWLTWLYGERPDGLLWIGGHGDGFKGRQFTEIEPAVAYAAQLDESARGGVYHRLTTMRPLGSEEKGRGAAADSAYLPALAMDLDLAGPGHKEAKLPRPETAQDLLLLLRKAGLPEPTTWIHSGGGRYPFWKFEQPIDLTIPGQLERAATVSRDLHRLVIEWAAEAGWKVDNTSDLARVYRLPGTMNRKTGEPTMCHVQYGDSTGIRFQLADLAGAVRRAARPREIDPGPADRPASAVPGPSVSQLFTDATPPEGPRVFSVAEAMAFLTPFLDALRSARDGEINVRLNDAAKAFSHFGEEFWPWAAARRELLAALEATEYDGLTWDAEDTLRSAQRSAEGDWKAVLRMEPAAALEAAEGNVEDQAVAAFLAELVSPDDLEELPPPVALIEGILNLDSEAWLIGPPGSKKSFVALDMAGCVSTGRAWQGREVHQGTVIIIAAEGAAGIGKRIKAWKRRYGPFGRVYILPRPVQAKDAGAWAVLVKACRQIGAALVVIDTQHRVTMGLEENSATDMGYYIAAVGALRRATGGCVLTLHHTGRKGGDARGSSALDGAQDTELTIAPGADKLRAELRVTKQKDQEESDPIPLRFAVETVGPEVTSLVLEQPGAFVEAEVRPEDDHGADVHIPEPVAGDWTWAIFDNHNSVLRRRILSVLASTTTPGFGITQAACQKSVLGRWYEGQPMVKSKRAGRLAQPTWDEAFTAVVAAVDAASGEQVVVERGAKYSLNPVIQGAARGGQRT